MAFKGDITQLKAVISFRKANLSVLHQSVLVVSYMAVGEDLSTDGCTSLSLAKKQILGRRLED